VPNQSSALDLANLNPDRFRELGDVVRKLGIGCHSMEAVARNIVRVLYDRLAAYDACALLRFYKTHPFGKLPADLQHFAEAQLRDQPPTLSMKCLTLLATAGEKPEWNRRASSVGHKAIPLPSPSAVEKIPMVAQLVRQLGLDFADVVGPHADLILDANHKTLNVFYVPDAQASPFIPAQTDFVEPCKIRSVVGFGSLLPSADLFAVILFCKIPITRETADRLTTLALNIKEAILPFDAGTIFEN